jgi:dephospho-CoA kinase
LEIIEGFQPTKAQHAGKKKKMQIIGVTGGVASGKSTFCEACKNLGIPVIDADLLSKQATEPNTATYQQIVFHFEPLLGPSLFQDNNHEQGAAAAINRQVLGAFIFKDEKYKSILENIIHPYVKRRMIYQILRYFLLGYDRVMIEIPLLFEAGWDKWCTKTILISW